MPSSGKLSEAWILVHPSSVESGVMEYFRALRLQIIVGDTAQLLDFIGSQGHDAEAWTGPLAVSATTAELFPDYSIPSPAKVRKRSIVDFFRGAAPDWSDIFSGCICRISHYWSLRDAINARRDTIVTGVPGCGKTTLLMQHAVDFDFPGHKLMVDGLSAAEANLIVRRLDGQPALVLFDNVANDVQAFSILHQAPKVVVLGADRDYAVSSVGHLLSHQGYTIRDVSGRQCISLTSHH